MSAELEEMNSKSKLFFDKAKAYNIDGKNAFLDLKINIDSLRESISDIENKIYNNSTSTKNVIDELLEQF